MTPSQAATLVLLLALVATPAAGASAQVRVDRTQAERSLGYAGPPGFSHRRHRAVDCTACHSSAERHGGLVVKTVRDCQSCHHAPERQAECATCHTTQEVRGARPIPAIVTLSVWRTPRERRLPFAHERHTSVTCTTCHTTPVTLAPTRGCESCHDQHHTVEASCRDCHQSPKAAHTREVHLGCAGSGCHTLAGTVALQPARNVCLTCHQDLVNHNPGRQCGQCHQVNWTPAAPNPARRTGVADSAAKGASAIAAGEAAREGAP